MSGRGRRSRRTEVSEANRGNSNLEISATQVASKGCVNTGRALDRAWQTGYS